MESYKRIQAAIANTKRVLPGHFESLVALRSPKTGCGLMVTSYRGQSVSDGIGHLVFFDAQAGWEEYPNCPYITPRETAFINREIGGELDVVSLAEFAPETEVILDDCTGIGSESFVSATVKGVRRKHVDFVVAILGGGQGTEVLITFHPGDPIFRSMVRTEPEMIGKTVTVAEALKMGLETAKIVETVKTI